MLTLLLLIAGASFSLLIAPQKKIWSTIIAQSSLLFLLSFILLSNIPKFSLLSWYLTIDTINSPLLILSYWLLPVSLLARIGHLQKKRNTKSRLFIILSLIILLALNITFSSNNLILFFLGFESTLVPTLFLIRRWGNQQERIEAGYYFVFYTLLRSLPLLLGLIFLFKKKYHLSIPLFKIKNTKKESFTLSIFCLIAFLVKVPIFGFHLWLPKAHVEAPVAGSMILAAILLKMGGYGFIRLTSILLTSFQREIRNFLIPFCCWGGALTSLICVTQTDLKSLIAYSSVSHMRFMIAGISLLRTWSINGGIIVMVAHGLVSSALFCIANIFYERCGSRILSIRRGLKYLFLTLPTMWLLFACAKMGLPPFPNAIGELLTFSSISSHNLLKFLPSLLGILFTGLFSLIVFQQLKRGSLFKWNTTESFIKEREYKTLLLHILPLIVLILKLELMNR